MGVRERVASALRNAAEKFAKSESGLYVPRITPEEELRLDLKGRGHYDLYPKWIRKSVDLALETAGPVRPDDLEEACGFVLWRGYGENGARLTPPVALVGFRDMIDKLKNLGWFDDHDVTGENGGVLKVNGAGIRKQIEAAEATRKAGCILVIAWNAEVGHPNIGYHHCSMHSRPEA